MQLVAYGAQDIYLTGNPQITFFKVVYRRHTNFAMESVEQTLDGTLAVSSTLTSTISRNGDLVGRMYLEVSKGTGTLDNPSANMIDFVECQIGGQQIDKHFGHWMEVWAELTEFNSSATTGLANNTNGTNFQNMSGMGGSVSNAGEVKHFVPLFFWFCRNPGVALPLIALQYHEVKIRISMAAVQLPTALSLWADYIYLDTDERRRFAQVSHEYLIDQVQHNNIQASTSNKLIFNHPVKEIIWTGATNPLTGVRSAQTDTNWRLVLNGSDRFAKRDLRYFTRTQVWQHHTGPGGLNTASAADGRCNDSICVYSFALKPEEHQPSGTCNFSRIDNAELVSDSNAGSGHIYAVNYNILRVMSGMGGLAYSN